MISSCLKRIRKARKDGLSVMTNFYWLSMNGFRRADDLAAKMLSDRLVPKTNTKRRCRIGKTADNFERYPCRIRRTRSRRKQYFLRLQLMFDLIHRYLVIANDLHIRSEFAKILHEVVS